MAKRPSVTALPTGLDLLHHHLNQVHDPNYNYSTSGSNIMFAVLDQFVCKS